MNKPRLKFIERNSVKGVIRIATCMRARRICGFLDHTLRKLWTLFCGVKTVHLVFSSDMLDEAGDCKETLLKFYGLLRNGTSN